MFDSYNCSDIPSPRVLHPTGPNRTPSCRANGANLESQVGLDDELDVVLTKSVRKKMELFYCHGETSVRHWYPVSICAPEHGSGSIGMNVKSNGSGEELTDLD